MNESPCPVAMKPEPPTPNRYGVQPMRLLTKGGQRMSSLLVHRRPGDVGVAEERSNDRYRFCGCRGDSAGARRSARDVGRTCGWRNGGRVLPVGTQHEHDNRDRNDARARECDRAPRDLAPPYIHLESVATRRPPVATSTQTQVVGVCTC